MPTFRILTKQVYHFQSNLSKYLPTSTKIWASIWLLIVWMNKTSVLQFLIKNKNQGWDNRLIFECFPKNYHGMRNKKRQTIWIKTYISILFYRNTKVNRIQSIHFGLFILQDQPARSKLLYLSQTCELVRMARWIY